jgi:anaerobic magnesium-protoporphyrin IX monomethyl ester cyclase
MTRKMIDLLLISPNSKKMYQDLAEKYSAIETNPRLGYLAACVRNKFGVSIYDMEAEPPKSDIDIINKVNECNPKTIVFVAEGQNVNASACVMSAVCDTAEIIRNYIPDIKIGVCGGYCSALPDKVLNDHSFIDFVFLNEGFYSLKNLLENNGSPEGIPGIWYKSNGRIEINKPERVVPQDLMARDIGHCAYDLMPSLDKYRCPLWHSEYSDDTTPYASIYTSFGCPYQCQFCAAANSLNRNSNDLNKTAADFNIFRHFDPEFIIKDFEYLASKGVRNIKITDELFVLKKTHFLPICNLIKERFGNYFRIWCYSRINTIRSEYLKSLKDAGVFSLALGIEASSQVVRQEIDKGRFTDVDIRTIVRMIEESGIQCCNNFIVGLQGDTWETMQETLNLALELLGTNTNIYSACALPGSPLYLMDKSAGKRVPEKYSEFGFLSYDHVCSSTDTLSSADVLSFRDYFFTTVFENPRFHNKIKNLYGENAVQNIKDMTKIKLKRKLLGD